VEDLFQARDRILRVEHIGMKSHMLTWMIWQTLRGGLQYQMEASNGQFFSLLPSNFIPLGLIMESDELNFLLEKLSKLRLLQIHDFFG
jgi:hypothetical protein